MSDINDMRKRLLAQRIGDFDDVTIDDLMKAAEDAEAVVLQIGPFDPAYTYFVQRREDFLKAAVLQEAQG